MLAPTFHLSVFLLNVFTFWYDQLYVNLPMPDKDMEKWIFKGRLTFFTYWCIIVQTIYFGVAFLNDILGTNASSPKRIPLIRKTKDILFTLVFPVAIFVTVTFWGIYYVDKELIMPEAIEKEFPVWMNHVLHTLISVFITFELVAFFRNYPSRKTGMLIMGVFSCTYIILVNVLYIQHNVWMYPVLHVLKWPLKIAFFGMSLLLSSAIYVLGERINNTVWSKHVRSANKKVKN